MPESGRPQVQVVRIFDADAPETAAAAAIALLVASALGRVLGTDTATEMRWVRDQEKSKRSLS